MDLIESLIIDIILILLGGILGGYLGYIWGKKQTLDERKRNACEKLNDAIFDIIKRIRTLCEIMEKKDGYGIENNIQLLIERRAIEFNQIEKEIRKSTKLVIIALMGIIRRG